jgi:hypothetical protein
MSNKLGLKVLEYLDIDPDTVEHISYVERSYWDIICGRPAAYEVLYKDGGIETLYSADLINYELAQAEKEERIALKVIELLDDRQNEDTI